MNEDDLLWHSRRGGLARALLRLRALPRGTEAGRENIRTRSQALIDDDLLLDLPPDTYMHSLVYGLDLARARYLLFTHSHSDHCAAEDIELLRKPYSHTCAGIEVYGNEWIREKIVHATGNDGGEAECFHYHVAQPNRPYAVGGYTVTPLRATHDRNEL